MSSALLLALLSAAPVDGFKAGAASVDITPPVGTPMAGYYAERLSQGVHDPLYAKAVVMECGGKKAASSAWTSSAPRRRWSTRPAGRSKGPRECPAQTS